MLRPKPRGRHLRTTLAALTAGLLLFLAGCAAEQAQLGAVAGGSATEGTGPVLDPFAGAPVAGTCYRLDEDDMVAATNSSPPLPDCLQTHTARTFHVGVVDEGESPGDSELVRQACRAALPDGTGLDEEQLLSSVISWIWFEPTTAQKGAGARWFRCDVIAQSGNEFLPLPPGEGAGDFFHGEVPPEYKRCIRAGADADGDGESDAVHVTCAEEHDYEWTGSFTTEGPDEHPADEIFIEWAQEHCSDIVGHEDWWATWPSEAVWELGERRMSCYGLVEN